jgi:hypothetical protein
MRRLYDCGPTVTQKNPLYFMVSGTPVYDTAAEFRLAWGMSERREGGQIGESSEGKNLTTGRGT